MRFMTRAMTPKVRMDKAIFIRLILARYFEAKDLSLATSLTVRVDRPRSAKMPKIAAKARAKDRMPKPSVPRKRAVYIM